jgi:beta-N-acetylhexosaminidase
VLLCNRPDLADELLGKLKWDISAVSLARLARMHGKLHPPTMVGLHENAEYVHALRAVSEIGVKEGSLKFPV